jgi:hypothetical protein
VASVVKVTGVLGKMDFVENPGVQTATEVICGVLDDVLYEPRVFCELVAAIDGYSPGMES